MRERPGAGASGSLTLLYFEAMKNDFETLFLLEIETKVTGVFIILAFLAC